ncbi:MAG: AMP-binding protein [Burkholderiales bacterium]|nr:AMP-binding protein [Burkholderiales bacterium]
MHNGPGIFGGLTGVGDILSRNARVSENKLGLVFEDVRLSWSDVNVRSCRFANAMRELGVRRGDRVGIFARNSHQWVESSFALSKLGAIVVTVNNRLSPPEIAYILENSGVSMLIVAKSELQNAKLAMAQVAACELLIGIETEDESVIDYETMVALGDPSEPVLDTPLAYDEPSMLLYTSGTTGFPKGAIYTHGSTLLGMFVHVHAIGSRGTHRVMLPSPLYSAAGTAGIYCAAYVGSTSVIVNFDAERALETLAREKITFTNLVPTTIQRLLARPDFEQYDLSALDTILYGGSPIPVAVLREAKRKLPKCRFRQTFASTETGTAGTVLEPADHELALTDPAYEHRLLSCGKPQVAVDVAIFDDKGLSVPVGTVGEIGVRTEANIVGFWGNPQATAEAIRDGWVLTGDLARIDEDGYVYLVDRKKDLIVTGAFNVYPSEVERVLQSHQSVYEVAVIGVPSVEWGESIKAVVVLKPGRTISAQDLITWCDGRIAGYKKPKTIDFVDTLPRNPTGKVLHRQLREPYWQQQDRKI